MVMTLRNFILIVSIVLISSFSAFAQNVENKQGPSSITSPASEKINSTTSPGAESQSQPANLPATLPQQQRAKPFSQQTSAPGAKLNQPGAFPGQPGTVSPPGPMPVPTSKPGPLAPQQITPTPKQPTVVPDGLTEKQNIQPGQAGKKHEPEF